MKIGPQLETEKKFMDDISKYAHSPVHLAVARRDYASLKRIVASLPRLPIAGEVTTEEESLAAEQKAESVSKTIDRRDVPGRETPLHLAVRLGDALAVEILMAAGSDWSLQNEQGWSALQEAVCTREDAIAMIIARHYQPLAWAKWCRRLPRIVSTVAQIRDFYMEISFHFESSVIPFIGRIAPSDTYRIWKRGSNLRADMTLAGFDGFRIQRSDQSFLFLGEGTDDGKLGRGSLIVLAHKEKEITNALEGAGSKPTEAEVAHEVALMSQTNMYRPGIDVTLAELVPHLNWRRQDRTEMVGGWKAKVYDMLHVMVSVKSRRVPGAMTDEELFAAEDERINEGEHDGVDYEDILTAEERLQLDSALRMENSSGLGEDEGCGGFGGAECQGNGVGSVSHLGSYENCEPNGVKEKKSWFGWNKKGSKSVNDEKGSCWDNGSGVEDNTRILKKFSKLAPESSGQKSADHRLSSESTREEWGEVKKGKEKVSKKKKKSVAGGDSKHESEYKKGLRPVLWLTQDFPLKTEELLPLLDILANKVKAVRRLRELLTTKLPQGTFPVKVAIPIVPTIRVLVTFTKFKELQPLEEFSTPLSSPDHFQDSRAKEAEASTSWISWMRGSHVQSSESDSRSWQDDPDPFHIPSDYSWVDANEKKRRMRAKRAKSKKGKKQGAKHTEGQQQQQLNDDLEE